MKDTPTVTVNIDANGNVTVDVSCIEGTSCKDLTKELEGALGKVTHDKLKPEYTKLDTQAGQHQTLGGGL